MTNDLCPRCNSIDTYALDRTTFTAGTITYFQCDACGARWQLYERNPHAPTNV